MRVSRWELDRQFPPYREGMIRRGRAGEGNRYGEGQRGREEMQSHCSCVGLLAAVVIIVGLLPHWYIFYFILSLNKHWYYISGRSHQVKSITFLPDPHYTRNKCLTF